MKGKTTIQIDQSIWSELNKRKLKSSDTFINVLRRLLEIEEKDGAYELNKFSRKAGVKNEKRKNR